MRIKPCLWRPSNLSFTPSFSSHREWLGTFIASDCINILQSVVNGKGVLAAGIWVENILDVFRTMNKTGKVKQPWRPLGGSRDCRSVQGGWLLFTALTRVHINPRHTWIDWVKCIPTAAQDEIFTCIWHCSRAPGKPLLDGAGSCCCHHPEQSQLSVSYHQV